MCQTMRCEFKFHLLYHMRIGDFACFGSVDDLKCESFCLLVTIQQPMGFLITLCVLSCCKLCWFMPCKAIFFMCALQGKWGKENEEGKELKGVKKFHEERSRAFRAPKMT